MIKQKSTILALFERYYIFNFILFVSIHFSLFGNVTPSHLLSSLNIQPPQFTPSEIINNCSGERIVERLRPLLKEHLASTNYDRLQITLQFLNHYIKQSAVNPNLSPLTILHSFQYDFSLKKNRGSSCVGLSLDMLARLPKDIQGYIVAAKLPEKYQQFAAPYYCHIAVLIPFKNPEDKLDVGFVLLDPSFDIDEPILLKPEVSYYYQLGEKGIWTFHLKNDYIQCDIHPLQVQAATSLESKDMEMTYRTDRLLNPIESIGIPMLIIDRRLSLLARSENGQHLSHVNIELNKFRIIWDSQEKMFAPISFADFEKGIKQFDDHFAAGLYMTAEELNQHIHKILTYKYEIDTLYLNYLEFLESSQDFSITGSLNPLKLRNTITMIKNSIGKLETLD